jgi:uncharacterized protein (TIGR03083 family)
MDRDTYLGYLAADGGRIATLAEAHLDAPVPTCPEWRLRDLVEHLGGVYGWLTEAGRVDRDAPPAARIDLAPPAGTSHADWLRAAVDHAVATYSAIEPDATRWTWAHGPGDVAQWYFRRLAQETLVHRLDAELAAGEVTTVDPALAVDGVDEMFDMFMPASPREPIGGNGETLHLHATDAEGEWLLTFHPDRVEATWGHAKGDAAIRGTARDLLLQVWGRDPIGEIEVFGDETVVATFRAAAKL